MCAFGVGDNEGMKWRWCDWDELAVNLLLQFLGIEVAIKTGSVHVGLFGHIGLCLVFFQLVPPGICDEVLFKRLHQHHYRTKSECSDHAFGPDDTSLQNVTTICFWQCPTTALLHAIAGRKPYKLLRRRHLKQQGQSSSLLSLLHCTAYQVRVCSLWQELTSAVVSKINTASGILLLWIVSRLIGLHCMMLTSMLANKRHAFTASHTLQATARSKMAF